MHRIRYRITTLSPVVIASKAGDMNMITTERYIPGTSVLGILAARVIKKKNLSESAHEDSSFYKWFLAGKLKISNAYIFTKDKYDRDVPHVPVPFSIQKEKNDETKIYNRLYAEDLDDIQTKSIDSFCAPNFLYEDAGDDRLQTKAVETSLNFHHARDPEKGKIFNYESISLNQVFEGEITGEQADLQELLMLNLCDDETPCYVGRSKNAQYGKINLEFVDKEPTQCDLPEMETDDGKISLTFLSDTILYNDNGFSTADISELENYLGKGVKIEKAFVKKGQTETFVNKWQLRKPSETCFLAGSTFLLENISKDHLDRFAELQQTGIGERTHEGFGRCVFGWATDKELYEPKEDSDKLEKPEHPIPEMSQKILETIVRDSIRKQAELAGLKDQNDFKKGTLPSNALIGRLLAIVKGNGTRATFKKHLEKLIERKPARNQLEYCNNEKKTLCDFLMDKDMNAQSILNKSSKLKDICNEIGYKPEEDNELANLYQIYFEAFFSMMRKRSKEKGD